jgi:hypothetical protein
MMGNFRAMGGGRREKRKDNAEAQSYRRERKTRAQAKACATSGQRFSGGFGWDKMAREGLKK